MPSTTVLPLFFGGRAAPCHSYPKHTQTKSKFYVFRYFFRVRNRFSAHSLDRRCRCRTACRIGREEEAKKNQLFKWFQKQMEIILVPRHIVCETFNRRHPWTVDIYDDIPSMRFGCCNTRTTAVAGCHSPPFESFEKGISGFGWIITEFTRPNFSRSTAQLLLLLACFGSFAFYKNGECVHVARVVQWRGTAHSRRQPHTL